MPDAISTALSKRVAPTDSALMPPPPPPKRIKRPPKVLDEETYEDATSYIIARDFYPALFEVNAQQDYFNALDEGDEDWIEDAGRRVKYIMTPGPDGQRRRRDVSMTPVPEFPTSGTPISTPRGSTCSTPTPSTTPSTTSKSGPRWKTVKGEKVDTNLSLTVFQARYTSEDSESFNALLDRQNAKHAQKYAWAHHHRPLPSRRLLAQEASKRRQGLLTAAHTFSSESGGEDSTALVQSLSENPDERPAMISLAHTKHNPRNGLMFIPESIETSAPHLHTRAQAAADASNAPPRTVNYANVRLPLSSKGDEATSIPPSPSVSAVDAAIRGQHYSQNASTAASETIDSGSETPRVNGYAFVDAEPTPVELALTSSPQRTTKLTKEDHVDILEMIRARADSGADSDATSSGTGFTIKESSRRENLHHAMVEKVAKENRRGSKPGLARLEELKGVVGKTPTPRFESSPRISLLRSRGAKDSAAGNISPAGQALYSQLGMGTKRVEKSLFGNNGRGEERRSFTPKPLRVKRAA